MDLRSTIQSSLFGSNTKIIFDYTYLGSLHEGNLHPDELTYCEKLGKKRRIEFTVSRTIARKLFKQLHIQDSPLLPLDSRMPNWPEGITGSIAHSSELCMVVIAQKKDIASIGIDIEARNRLHPKLWSACLTANEERFVTQKPLQEQASWATLIFSAKESFFKFQYPITHQWIGFKEAEIVRFPETLNDDTYTLKLLTNLSGAFIKESVFTGRFLFTEKLVITTFLTQ